MAEQNFYNSAPSSPPNSSMAIVSLVAGILGLTIVPTLGSIVAVITGIMAKNEIRTSRGTLSGEGMAKAGVILGWIGIALTVIGVCFFGVLVLLPLLLVALGLSADASGWILPFLLELI
jgi:hypothetical protein